jgi:predicted P-loop ATPase
MVVTNQGKGKETTISYANTKLVGEEWYADKIAETKKGLISMEIGFKILEHGN